MSTSQEKASSLFSLPPERERVAQMTSVARKSVLEPAEPGSWSSSWRYAVAGRIARHYGQDDLFSAYEHSILAQDAEVADPSFIGRDAREKIVLAFLDRVSKAPRDIVQEDIAGLVDANLVPADIVRLCELAAFLAYEARVVTGLRLMRDTK